MKKRWRDTLGPVPPFAGALLLSVLIPSLLAAVDTAEDPGAGLCLITESYPMMATRVGFRILAAEGREQAARGAIDRARNEMQAYIDVINTWDPRSDAWKVNESAGMEPVAVDRRLLDLLTRASDLSGQTGGAFDITFSPVGRLWKLWSDEPVIPTREQVEEALALVNYRDLIVDSDHGTAFLRRKGMRFDLGGIGKGAAVDVAAESLMRQGFDDFLVEAGGDLRVHGQGPNGPWRIGIQGPRDIHGKWFVQIPLTDRALATSGDYERMVQIGEKRYHHIIDTRTGWPAEKCISVSVVANDLETADALATAFFVLGPEQAIQFCEEADEVEAMIVDPGFRIWRSSGFPEGESAPDLAPAADPEGVTEPGGTDSMGDPIAGNVIDNAGVSRE